MQQGDRIRVAYVGGFFFRLRHHLFSFGYYSRPPIIEIREGLANAALVLSFFDSEPAYYIMAVNHPCPSPAASPVTRNTKTITSSTILTVSSPYHSPLNKSTEAKAVAVNFWMHTLALITSSAVAIDVRPRRRTDANENNDEEYHSEDSDLISSW